MKKFSDMALGEEFVIFDDGEFYQSAYKIDDTTMYVSACGASYEGRETVKDLDIEYEVTGRIFDVHDSITDLERAALTLASSMASAHPALEMWKKALLDNKNEMRDLDTFAFENRFLLADCESLGYKIPLKRGDGSLFLLILGGKPDGKYDSAASKSYRANGGKYDAPVLALLWEVVKYRRRGRVSGEYEYKIEGMNVTTSSLAAAINEYHLRMLNFVGD